MSWALLRLPRVLTRRGSLHQLPATALALAEGLVLVLLLVLGLRLSLGLGSPYGVLILTAADKLLNAGSFSSLSALCGLMLVGVTVCVGASVCVCGCI